MLQEERHIFCDGGAVVGVQCTRGRNYDSKVRQNVTCSTEDALRCYDNDTFSDGCNDYKLRFFCECPQGIHKRSASANSALLKNCGKWSQWKNTHHPSDGDQNDKEEIDQSFVKPMCPTDIGATIPIIQCRDEHTNETFQGNKNYEWFRVTCKDAQSGLKCTRVDGKCNDFSVRFFCSCSPDAFNQGNTGAPSASLYQSQPIHISHSGTKKGTLFGIKHSDWKTIILVFVVLAVVFTVIISGVLFVLYRETLRRKQAQSVHPLQRYSHAKQRHQQKNFISLIHS